ncbi:MAG TPA: response regulator [Phototrophicaceae bacterium]|nr:response regulator [Phototrophicaceae bacterium]
MTRILAIDDDDLILEQVVMWFEAEGYEVASALNGAEGVELAVQQPPDLIVCDISMPEMSGYDVLVELRQHPETALVPFMFLTAQSDRAFVRHGMELGADDYLTKPFTRPELLSAARTRLQRRSVVADSYAQELDEIKSSLARKVTHELKTPLSNIQLVKDIIERHFESLSQLEVKDLMEALGSGTERLNHLVDQMVYVTQLDGGVLSEQKIQENGIVAEIGPVILGAIDQGRRFAFRNRNLNIVVSDIRNPKALVLAHTQALRHALAELVANALNFSPEKGEVSISEWQTGGFVWISVLDVGIGMTPEQQTQAVQAFEQINRETQEQQGVGLGLPLVKRILEAHSGKVEIHSLVGKGTQVIVCLPVLESA